MTGNWSDVNVILSEAGYTDRTIQSVLERYYMSEEKKPEWITTREAQSLLKVTTTQGVWNVIERAQRYHEFEARRRNIGTEDMPRYLLNREDVERVAELMGKTDD